MSITGIFLAACVVALWVAVGVYGYTSERRVWNGGVCKQNGLPWQMFDRDSQGGRGYKAGGIYCWISWPGVDS